MYGQTKFTLQSLLLTVLKHHPFSEKESTADMPLKSEATFSDKKVLGTMLDVASKKIGFSFQKVYH